jgi:hypothetical protein
MANKGYNKRKIIFDKFSDQLSILRAKGFIKGKAFQYPKSYLCPLCLNEFSEHDLVERPTTNFLTLEDSPPASLGGSKIALTCKECNSRCGHELDYQLVEAIREVDNSYFYPGSKQHGIIDFEGKRLSVEITAQGDGQMTAYHRTKHNDPTILQRFIFGLKNSTVGPILNLKPPKSRVDQHKVGCALLKTHYIITFSKFGYLFLMDKVYNPIREQIRNPDKHILSDMPFLKDQFLEGDAGTYYVTDSGVESILNIFVLKTEYSKTIFGGFLPVPTITLPTYTTRIESKRGPGNVVKLYRSKYDPNADLFTDYSEMQKIWNWIGQAK